MNRNARAMVITACLCLVSCARYDQKAVLSKQLSDHPARTFSVWADWRKKDVRERIGPAPEVLLDYLRIDNELHGITVTPKPAEDGKAFVEEISQAIAEFPAEVRQQLDQNVIGIFLVTNLGSSGYTEALKDDAGHVRGFIVLDTNALDKKANAWASWKDSTPFKPSPHYTVSVLIESENGNSRKNAISHILLHELGHMVGLAKEAHGNWRVSADPADYLFTSLSWSPGKGQPASRWDETFRDRSRIRFYAGDTAQLPEDKLPGIYAELAKTDFVSLYAATGIYDDFAETYAMYVHVVLQKRPWQLAVLYDGRPVMTMMEPIQQKRCEKKRQFLARLFAEELSLRSGDGVVSTR